MELENFRKTVLRSVVAKDVKLGMKLASKSTLRTLTAHGIVALKRDVGGVIQSLSNYVLGMQMSAEMKQSAFVSMGEVGADLVFLARTLKVKTPVASKKVKLTGTRTAALLQLDRVSNDLLDIVSQSVFSAPKMHSVQKSVVMPAKGGIKEMRDVMVVDPDAQKDMDTERLGTMKSLVAAAVDIYWRLCYNIFEKTPLDVFAGKYERMVADSETTVSPTKEEEPQLTTAVGQTVDAGSEPSPKKTKTITIHGGKKKSKHKLVPVDNL